MCTLRETAPDARAREAAVGDNIARFLPTNRRFEVINGTIAAGEG